MATVSSSDRTKTLTCAQLPGWGGSINPAISASRPRPDRNVPRKKPSWAIPTSSSAKAASATTIIERWSRPSPPKCWG